MIIFSPDLNKTAEDSLLEDILLFYLRIKMIVN